MLAGKRQHEGRSMSTTRSERPVSVQLPHDVQKLHISARLVYLVLRIGGPATKQQIRASTGLSGEAARSALSALIDNDVVIRRPDPEDGRRSRFVLKADLQPHRDLPR